MGDVNKMYHELREETLARMKNRYEVLGRAIARLEYDLAEEDKHGIANKAHREENERR